MKKRWMLAVILFLLVLTFGPARVQAATPVGEAVDMSVVSMYDSTNILTTPLTGLAYGTKVAFDESISSNSSYEFVCWTVNGAVHPNMDEYTEFMVTNNLHLTARYKPAGSYAVVFMDTNGQLIDIEYTTIGNDIVAPDVSGITKPGYVLDTVDNWDSDFSNVTQDMFVTVQYVIDSSATFTLSVENGTDATPEGTGTYDFNDVVTVTADADDATNGIYFQYWRIGNRIVSNEASYSFTMLENTVITAVYGGSALVATPMVTMSEALSLHSGYDSYLGQYFLPAGNTYVEHGLVTSGSVNNPTLDDDGITQKAGTKINGATGEFLMSVDNTSGSPNVRAYLVYRDAAEALHTVYSDVQTPELLFSEYGENGANKWIEIYNPTSSSVSLEGYSVSLYTNGATEASSTQTFTGISILAGDVYVLYNSGATADVTDWADSSSSVCNFNGDDAISLIKGTEIIDVIGVIGVDPGAAWAVGERETQDATLTRITSLVSPNANWNEEEWITYPIDTYDYVGFQGVQIAESITVSGADSVTLGLTTSLTAAVNPRGSVQDVIWSSDNPSIASVNSNGVVTGEALGTTTIYAECVENGEIVGSHEITVSEGSLLEEFSYTLTINSTDVVVPTSTTYVTVTDNDPSNGTWSGKANKTTVDSQIGFGQKAGYYLTFTAPEGYYVYSVSLSFNSGGSTLRQVLIGSQVIAEGTGINTVYTSAAPVVLTGGPSSFTFSVNTGTNNLISVTVVCKPL